jgi:hypothetical protein
VAVFKARDDSRWLALALEIEEDAGTRGVGDAEKPYTLHVGDSSKDTPSVRRLARALQLVVESPLLNKGEAARTKLPANRDYPIRGIVIRENFVISKNQRTRS